MAGLKPGAPGQTGSLNGKVNLYSIGGEMTRTVKSDTAAQLNSVAINSGITGVSENNTNSWEVMNDNRYGGYNIDKGSQTHSYPTNESYTNK